MAWVWVLRLVDDNIVVRHHFLDLPGDLFGISLSTMQSRIAHIRRELEEIEADPYDGSEIADVILLLMHQARSYNIDLMADLLAKADEVRTRKWGEPDHEGVVEHIRE